MSLHYILMSKIVINSIEFKIHPVYDLYAADENGNIILFIKRVPHKGNDNSLQLNVRKHKQNGCKCYYIHWFIWEYYNGLIPDSKVIDHINDIKDDNRLCNIQLMTPQQNS